MPKRRPTRRAAAKRTRRRSTGKVVLPALTLCLTASGLTLAAWGRMGTRLAARQDEIPPPAPPLSYSPANPSKEYIYAGGRLVATEEPSTNASPGAVVARTLNYYDEESYFGTGLSLLTCAPGQGRESFAPAARGNVTTVSRWLDSLGGVSNTSAYVDTHTQYDQCGNVRKSYDAAVRGSVSARVSETEYSTDYQSAYPTRTLTPTPDATGQQGANGPLVTSSVYDLDTGLVLSVRDESNYTSSNNTEVLYSYRDPDNPALVAPLDRLRLVTNPDGGWTRYDYGVTPGSLYIRTRTALDSARATDTYQYFDALGRPTRSYA